MATLSEQTTSDVTTIFSACGETLTYNGSSISALIGETGHDRTETSQYEYLDIEVQVSDVTPAYGDTVVYNSQTWRLRHMDHIKGDDYTKQIRVIRNERPIGL